MDEGDLPSRRHHPRRPVDCAVAVQATLEPRDQRRANIDKGAQARHHLAGGRRRGVPGLLAMGTDVTPGRAAAVYSDIKTAKYSDQSNFMPFNRRDGTADQCRWAEILGQGLRCAGGGTAQVRASRRAALRGQQVLIVTEIHAPALAVGDVGGGCVWVCPPPRAGDLIASLNWPNSRAHVCVPFGAFVVIYCFCCEMQEQIIKDEKAHETHGTHEEYWVFRLKPSEGAGMNCFQITEFR